MSARVMILMHYDTVAPVKRNINDIREWETTERMQQKANSNNNHHHTMCRRMWRTTERWTRKKKSLRKTRKVTWPLPA